VIAQRLGLVLLFLLPCGLMLIENEVPEDVIELLADFEFVLESRGYAARDQIRFMALFMYKRIKEKGRTYPTVWFGKMLGALQKAHTDAWKSTK